MTSGLSDGELEAFLDSLKRLLADRCTEADVRRVIEERSGHDPGLWRELSAMGLPALMLAPEHGGLGAGPVVLERAMEELGAALCPAPMLSCVLAGALVEGVGDAAVAARILPGIADGSAVPACALTGPAADWSANGVAVHATAEGNGWRLAGSARLVLDAAPASLLLVAAHTEDGIALFEVDPGAPGLALTALPSFDRTLFLSDIAFDNVAARRLSPPGDGWANIARALDIARVALAGEQAGAARRLFEITIEYARSRHQFGRAIGSFQAVKHMAADLLLETESSVSAARHAAAALAEGAADAGQSVSLAAFACADAFVRTAADSIQMHGGIAFTWVHPAHLYLRRARADAFLLGSPASMRARFLAELGG